MLWHKCRCGAVIPQGISLCDVCTAVYAGQGSSRKEPGGTRTVAYTGHESRHMEYNRARRDKKAAAFYVSADWRRVREVALRLYDGMDMYAYYVQHRIVAADMVHHIVEIGDDWDRRLELANLFPLSNSNHGTISALYGKDEMTKRATQEQLRDIIDVHWKDSGGIEKVLASRI